MARRLERRVHALTTNVDLHATLAEVFDIRPRHRTHGRSLVPLLRGETDSVASGRSAASSGSGCR